MDIRPGLGIEEDAICRGVRGFFYESDPLEKLPGCLEALINGQLWYSRKILANRVQRLRTPKKMKNLLLERELEILRHIIAGATNREMAGRLLITQNTVKSHVYRIYKKIKVPNRLQATFWAAQYL